MPDLLRAGLAVVALVACGRTGGPAPAPEPPDPRPTPSVRGPPFRSLPDGICDGIRNSYECAQAKEAYQLERAPASISRSEDVLVLRLTGDRVVRIRDRRPAKPNVAEVVLHSYLGFHRGLGRHLVEVQYYEGGGYLLVHPVTGRRTRIAALPVLSPEAARFAVVTSAYDYASASVLQIWRIDDALRKEWQADLPRWRSTGDAAAPPPWAPRSVTWTGPGALRVTLEVRSSALETREAGAVQVVRKGGSWSFGRDPAEVVREAVERSGRNDPDGTVPEGRRAR